MGKRHLIRRRPTKGTDREKERERERERERGRAPAALARVVSARERGLLLALLVLLVLLVLMLVLLVLMLVLCWWPAGTATPWSPCRQQSLGT